MDRGGAPEDLLSEELLTADVSEGGKATLLWGCSSTIAHDPEDDHTPLHIWADPNKHYILPYLNI